MHRGEASAADLIEDLEMLELGDARELEELAFGDDSAASLGRRRRVRQC